MLCVTSDLHCHVTCLFRPAVLVTRILCQVRNELTCVLSVKRCFIKQTCLSAQLSLERLPYLIIPPNLTSQPEHFTFSDELGFALYRE